MNLADKIEALTGPDREVDAAIQIAVFGDVPFGNCWPFTPTSTPMLSEYVEQFRDTLNVDDAIPDDVLPRYTASLDAAMTLVPEGHKYWNIGGSPTQGFAGMGLYGASINDEFYGEAHTPALALCAAALRATQHTSASGCGN